jgi:hypothetical protein
MQIQNCLFNMPGLIHTFILAVVLMVIGCNSDRRKSFYLHVKHYAGGPGLTIIYTINEKGLQVETNCDLEKCKQRTVYNRTFNKNQSDSIYQYIQSLRMDTLKSAYKTKGMFDGLVTKITIQTGFLFSHTSTFDNYSTPVRSKLFKYIDNLISPKKFRFYSWGEGE